MSRSLLLSLLIALFCAASPLHAQTTTSSLSGFGDSEERPVGAWRLPDGIELARPIVGYSLFAPEDCADPEQAAGVGEMVQVCLALRHTGMVNGAPSRTPIQVIIPRGVTLISDERSTQNGIVIRRITRVIQPGETIYIPLYAMCMNPGRSGSYPGAPYQLGPVLEHPGFDRLMDQLDRKVIGPEAVAIVQMAFWELSRGKPVARNTQAQIDALPEA